MLSTDALLSHWQGHRSLTRRTIEAFPAEQLFVFQPAPPVRSFGEMMLEVLNVLEPNLRGFADGVWTWNDRYSADSKESLLGAWDDAGKMLGDYWPRISAAHLQEVEPGYFYGGPPQPHLDRVLYFIDNEVHHRAQGFIYLRLLGIEPPLFFERGP